MTTTNLLALAVTVASVAFAVWGNLAYRAGRARAEHAAMHPATAAAATRLLRDYHASERPRFRLINTLLATAAGALLVPMPLGGWDHRIPAGLVEVGLACLGMALVYLADFALRPPTAPTPAHPAVRLQLEGER
jgi:hypothetical protein